MNKLYHGYKDETLFTNLPIDSLSSPLYHCLTNGPLLYSLPGIRKQVLSMTLFCVILTNPYLLLLNLGLPKSVLY